jgi:hypothetical protein
LAPKTRGLQPKPREGRRFSHTWKPRRRDRTGWLPFLNIYRTMCLSPQFERLFPGLFDQVAQAFYGWRPWILENTYLTCLSEHRHPDEDELGRLSMWRAYGGGTGVAVVMTPVPFLTESHALRAYASAVGYFTPAEFYWSFADVVSRIDAAQSFLRGIDPDEVRTRLFNVFLFASTCTKHPGFHERHPPSRPAPVATPEEEHRDHPRSAVACLQDQALQHPCQNPYRKARRDRDPAAC